MSRPESKNSAISFDSDSDGSDDDAALAPSPVSPILTPTPSLAEKLKKANADLLQGKTILDALSDGTMSRPRLRTLVCVK